MSSPKVLGEVAPLLIEYHHVLHRLETDASEAVLADLEKAQHKLEAADGWTVEQRVESVISRCLLMPIVNSQPYQVE